MAEKRINEYFRSLPENSSPSSTTYLVVEENGVTKKIPINLFIHKDDSGNVYVSGLIEVTDGATFGGPVDIKYGEYLRLHSEDNTKYADIYCDDEGNLIGKEDSPIATEKYVDDKVDKISGGGSSTVKIATSDSTTMGDIYDAIVSAEKTPSEPILVRLQGRYDDTLLIWFTVVDARPSGYVYCWDLTNRKTYEVHEQITFASVSFADFLSTYEVPLGGGGFPELTINTNGDEPLSTLTDALESAGMTSDSRKRVVQIQGRGNALLLCNAFKAGNSWVIYAANLYNGKKLEARSVDPRHISLWDFINPVGDYVVEDSIEIPDKYITEPELEERLAKFGGSSGGSSTYIYEAQDSSATMFDLINYLQSQGYISDTIMLLQLAGGLRDSYLGRINFFADQCTFNLWDVTTMTLYSHSNAISTSTTIVDALESATKTEIGGITEIPAEYITEGELNAKGYLTEHQSLEGYAKTTDLFSKDYKDLTNKPTIPSIEGLATEDYVRTYVETAILGGAW